MMKSTNPNLLNITSHSPKIMSALKENTWDMVHVYLKEKKKNMRGYGSRWHGCPDRWWVYNQTGGAGRERYRIGRSSNIHQFKTHKWQEDSYDVSVMQDPALAQWHIAASSLYTQTWDCSMVYTCDLNGQLYRTHWKNMNKDQLIKEMENMGVRYILQDKYTKPAMHELQYNKHALYSHNFPWFVDPKITQHHGDIDFVWKRNDKFDYSTYGGSTKTDRNTHNSFDSIWKKAEDMVGTEPKGGAAAKKSSGKKASSKAA